MKSPVTLILKTFFPKIALHYLAYKRLIKNKNSYLHSVGWMRSLEEGKPTNKYGEALPWMNFTVIKFLEERLKNDFVLFEYGSGYSTHFYATKVKTVTSLEYDKQWFQLVKKDIPENVELIFTDNDVDGDYCRAIGAQKKRFDVVVIDGRDRVNCVRQSIPALSPRGVIILDDSQREKYQEGIALAKEHGFRALSLEGLKATGKRIDRTTILYRECNCLEL